MPIEQQAGMKYFTFELFRQCGVHQGIFSRQGGISPAPWTSLNLGGTVGDSRENVIENRRRIFGLMKLPVESIYDAWQVHGTNVICVDQPRPLDTPHLKGDAILTDRPGITLFMRFADCVPVFLVDPRRRVVGIVHAGWRGTVDRIAAVAVEKMCSWYGSRPGDILGGIGPSIGVDDYQVGAEVIEAASHTFASQVDQVLLPYPDGIHFDLWKANQLVLQESGVEQIEIAGISTCSHLEDWYSHRAEHGKTGRFGALLALE